jgi:hypothetical protein
MPRGSRTGVTRFARSAALLLCLASCAGGLTLAGCNASSRDRSHDPAYMCPKLLERCRECRNRVPGFKEWDCNGSNGEILERCKGKAAAREQWLDKLGAALAQDTCREFEEAL